MRLRTVTLSLVAAAFSGCATTTAESPRAAAGAHLDAAQQRGHDFAVRRCGGCHNVGMDDGGPTEGPPFRRLALRYNSLSLERRFTEVSAHGFENMPPVSFTKSEADDLVAYVNGLQGS